MRKTSISGRIIRWPQNRDCPFVATAIRVVFLNFYCEAGSVQIEFLFTNITDPPALDHLRVFVRDFNLPGRKSFGNHVSIRTVLHRNAGRTIVHPHFQRTLREQVLWMKKTATIGKVPDSTTLNTAFRFYKPASTKQRPSRPSSGFTARDGNEKN